jgi:glycosyltransferase involved in cell wall biosynthesis
LLRYGHGGEAAAKNRGVEAATGDFVAFFDGDDVQSPRRLAAMGALAAMRPDLDILTTRCSLVRDGREIAIYPPDGWFPCGDQVMGMFANDFLPSPAIRRSALRRVGGLDETLPVSPDTDCAIRLLLGGSLAGQVDAALFSYVRRPGQQTENQVRAFGAEQQIFARYLDHPGVEGDRRNALLERLRTSRLHHLRAAIQESDPSARAIARAVALDHSNPASTRCKALLAMIWPGLASRLAR